MRNQDAHSHVRGESIYIDDIVTLHGTLYAAVFHSTIAHGDIIKLDVKKALEMPGVLRVLTAKDIPGENQIGGIIADEPLFAEQEVHYQGQPIALILATTPDIAEEATAAIDVDYNEKAIVVDPREAQAKKQFIVPPRTFAIGDVDTTWQQCHYIVSGQVDLAGQEHLYIETQGAYAQLKENNSLLVHSSTQGPTAVQRTISRVLAIPMHQIEIDVTRLGGGFGGKEDQATPWAVMAALATFIMKKPVKLVLHRLADMKMTGKRHPYQADYKIGLNKDYKILAYEVVFYQNAGAAADLSPAVMERTLFHATNAYYIPNVKATAYSCKTNVHPHTAFRGFGGPQGIFMIEAAIYDMAQQLQIDANIIQKANLLTEGDEFPYGQKTKDCQAINTWETAENIYALNALKTAVAQFNQANHLLKKGIALMPICFGISFTKTHMNQARALVHVYHDGSVGISTGAVEMGQGVNTKLRQIAANFFSIDCDHIKIESTNTTRVANTSPSAASSTTDLNGKALQDACNQILQRLLRHAATLLQLEYTDTLTLKEGVVYHAGKKTSLQWHALVQQAYFSRINLSANGHYATPEIHFDTTIEKGHPFAYHVYGTAIFTVTLDCLRGTYQFDSVKIVHDCGSSFNYLVDLGQIEGGLVQGMGWVTMEELSYDKQGCLLANALSTYKIPDIHSIPQQIEVHFLPTTGPTAAVCHAKAVGEPPLLYGIGAYFAIVNAMRAFKPDLKLTFSAPMTPEKVLLGLYGNEH